MLPYILIIEDLQNPISTLLRQKVQGELSNKKYLEDLAHRLQKHGPIFLKSLTENKILQLVELLIAKKWLEESPSEEIPFSLTKSVQMS
ncbi:OST-HTH associated domain protein [Medicago truncatula]|uniref:OST-HTH associated domain protein n=1 Tax=Medicago truncatula TaxID=3880 RepID=G7I537_MEDTR|nr:OST-HTH associated domain protein [Medicago truncatula]